jgi:hypothetical protein
MQSARTPLAYQRRVAIILAAVALAPPATIFALNSGHAAAASSKGTVTTTAAPAQSDFASRVHDDDDDVASPVTAEQPASQAIATKYRTVLGAVGIPKKSTPTAPRALTPATP